MAAIVVTRSIRAPIDCVFKTVADIGQFSQAVPRIVKAEILSDVKSGVGTRFRETRVTNGKESTTDLKVTEYVENDHVRIVADSGGTIWDTVFTVRPAGDHTELTMAMEPRAYKLIPKLVNPVLGPMIRKAVEQDLDAVKIFCER
jgi:ribosome-associated toxin RatA of RatAB toxin-antitoxin module